MIGRFSYAARRWQTAASDQERSLECNDRISVRHGRLRRRFGPEGVLPRRADPGGCALTVAATPMSLASVVYGGRRVADAEAEGELTLTGDRQLFDRFVTWFPLPEKIR